MAETITVDGDRLRAGADTVRGWVTLLEGSPMGGPARSALVRAEAELSGSRAASAVARVAGGVDAVASQVLNALHGLAGSLDTAAAAFLQVDVATGEAAERLIAGPGVAGLGVAAPGRVAP